MYLNNPPTWTDERTTMLEALWNKGYSASIIADKLGGVSRNAVLGKAFRLKLPMRVPSQRKAWTAPQRRKGPERRRETILLMPKGKPKSKLAELLAEAIPPPAENDVARVSLMDLERHHCRFPVGDPKLADFGFCGCKPFPGSPYCEAHARRAYTPTALKAEPGPGFNVGIRNRTPDKAPVRSLVDA